MLSKLKCERDRESLDVMDVPGDVGHEDDLPDVLRRLVSASEVTRVG